MTCNILLADGFEEIEAITPIDLLRRAGVTVELIDITNKLKIVKGARGISIATTKNIKDIIDSSDADAVIIPGGMNGSLALSKNDDVSKYLKSMYTNGKLVCAICAAPAVVLSGLGILKDRKYTCYPQMEEEIPQYAGENWQELVKNSKHIKDSVVIDGNLITSRGPGTASLFAFAIIDKLCGKEIAKNVRDGALF